MWASGDTYAKLVNPDSERSEQNVDAASNPAAVILDGLSETRAWQEALYRDIHQHPELSHQEQRTAGLIAEKLREFNYQLREGIGGTGVVGIMRNGDGPTVLMRADMDALPVEEATGLPYASTARATDPAGHDVPVMHACGHDVHITCLLGAAALLATAAEQWSGTAIALFQPAEEVGDGARGMVDDGLREALGQVDVALAQHVLPAPAASWALIAERSFRRPIVCVSRSSVAARMGRCRRPQSTP